MQRQFDLKDGSAFRLTTARYYTPSGRLIQRPYDKDKDEVSAWRRSSGRRLRERTSPTRRKRIRSRPKFKTMGGRVVYGGGGITPDYIVKSDRLNEYTVQLRSKLVFLQVADRILDRDGTELRETYGKDIARFVRGF